MLPSLDDLVFSLNSEILVAHSKDRLNELFIKKQIFNKITAILEKASQNQVTKSTFSLIVERRFDNVNYFYKAIIAIEDVTKKSIKNLLNENLKTAQSFEDFCKVMKTYEQTKFLPKDLRRFYFTEKKVYLIKSFAQDMFRKIEDLTVPSSSTLSFITLY